MSATTTAELINSLTPLENDYAGVHPRIHFTPQRIAWVKAHVDSEPWARHFKRVVRLADEGSGLHAAVVFLITDETKYRDAAIDRLRKLLGSKNWPDDVSKGNAPGFNTLGDVAMLYDWLYHQLDDELRMAARDRMNTTGRQLYEGYAKYVLYAASGYTWNISAHSFLDAAFCGAALYGEVDNVAPWMRHLSEHARNMTAALGPDGVSQEGISYGGFYTEYYIRLIDLVRDMLAIDLYQDNAYLREVRNCYLYSMLGRDYLSSGNVHITFGDCVRYNWHGPDYFLRKLAAEYQDPYAQWVAQLQDDTDATKHGGAFLNLLWTDANLKPKSPEALPTMHHFADKDIVIMRSSWEGDESVFAFKCGPHSGHHALKHYTQCIGGGHMAPDAGCVQLHAHGEWLLCNAGYAQKFTRYHNTALVNGIGQTGETDGKIDWFECTELRREQRGPRIAHASAGKTYDYAVGDVAPAYEHDAGVKQHLRHVLYAKPDCWIIVDEFQADGPATYELFFHSYAQLFETDHPFTPADENVWDITGEHGCLRTTTLGMQAVTGSAELQNVIGIGAHHDREVCTLRLFNDEPNEQATFITVLEAHKAGDQAKITAMLNRKLQTLTLTRDGKATNLPMRLDRDADDVLLFNV